MQVVTEERWKGIKMVVLIPFREILDKSIAVHYSELTSLGLGNRQQ